MPDWVVRATLLPLDTDLLGVAFRTGAFSDAERLTSGWGLAAETVDFPPACLRAFTELEDALCGAGRTAPLFTPLITGSLIRSSQISRANPQ